MKQRITGRVNGGSYEILATDGGVMQVFTLEQARTDTKLAAAIKRNGWPAIPEE